jgi:cephalosporin hydroxylase
MSKLKKIFYNEIKCGCDKWEPYFNVYETYFQKFVNEAPIVVEVGVQDGGSIEMWLKYFGPGALICGIDIDTNIFKTGIAQEPNVRLYLGDQESSEFWDSFFVQNPRIDIFIDDGGHTMNQQIETFKNVFPHINNGGVYICEDTHTSYMNHMGGGVKVPGTFIEYSKDLVDSLTCDSFSQLGISSVHYYNSMVVFIKGPKEEFNRVVVNK